MTTHTAQGHIGTVYQAANWIYVGEATSYCYVLGDEKFHPKTMSERGKRMGVGVAEYTKQSGLDFKRVSGLIMHKYAYPLDKSQIETLEGLALPYPTLP